MRASARLETSHRHEQKHLFSVYCQTIKQRQYQTNQNEASTDYSKRSAYGRTRRSQFSYDSSSITNTFTPNN